MLSIESTAKTVKQAIEDGLKKLNKSIDEVEVKIISQPGIFRKAKVLISVEEDEKPQVKTEEKPMQAKTQQQNIQAKRPMQERQEVRQERQEVKQEARQEAKQEAKQDNADGTNQRPMHKRDGGKDRQRDFGKDRQKRDDINKNRPDKSNQTKPEKKEGTEYKQREYREITDEAADTAANFVDGLLSRMGVEYSMIRKRENGALQLDITSESGATIGYRGETLDSIEYLASLSINKNPDKYYKVNVDCNGYRIKREEMLASMAMRLADKAVRTGRKVIMEPMNNFSRKVIHSALSQNDKIFTRSEGTEPYRHIVIIPKRK